MDDKWQPIETAPRDVEACFWLIPKGADEVWSDSSGNPITAGPNANPYRRVAKYGQWGCLWKAVLWAPLPREPTWPPRVSAATPASTTGQTGGAPGATDAERAAWLADKIAALGDYAKEAAAMLRRWPASTTGSAVVPAGEEASGKPSMRERIAAALECLEDNDNHGATVILKVALGSASGAKGGSDGR